MADTSTVTHIATNPEGAALIESGEATPPATVPSNATLVAYGGLAMPLCLAIVPILNYLPAFYAEELHLNVGLVGLVFLSARLWDGAADLLVGWFSDRFTSRLGRRKPWVLLGAPFLMISTWFLCNPSKDAGLLYLVFWAAFFYTAWTSMYIPYISWGAELATGYVERSRVTSFREAFTMIGNLFFAAAPLVLLPANAPLHEVLLLITVAVLVMVPLTVAPLGLLVKDPVPLQRAEAPLFKGLASLGKDRVLLLFISATLLIWIGEGVINSLVVFSFKVGLNLPDKLFWIIFIIYVTTLAVLPLALRISKRVEKHRLLAAAVAIKVLGFSAHVFLPPGNFPIVACLWVVVGVAQTFTIFLPTSILADIIDHGEAVQGERRSGAYVAIYNLAVKVGMALGVGLSFGLLDLVSFQPGAPTYSVTDQMNIRLLGFALPALLLAAAMALYLRHPITRTVQQQLRDVIDSRGVSSTAS